MRFILPKKIESIIALLNKAGFSAHVVGGCVRDLVLGKIPNDWDITTSASPHQVKKVFETTYDTGLKHGTVTVNYLGELCEVTTWRKETTYQDHRRPDKVEFTSSLTEDLARRDFTMNAMAYHPDEGLTDPFYGLRDIDLKFIRSVGDANTRFSEDALRMLRAIRFSAQLGFQIESATFSAIHNHCRDIAYVSSERIQSEINKILTSPYPNKLALLWETGLAGVIIPDIRHVPSSWLQFVSSQTSLKSIPFLMGTLFLFANQYSSAEFALKPLIQLKYDNDTIKAAKQFLLAMHDLKAITSRNIRKCISTFGLETTNWVLAVKAFLGEKPLSINNCSPIIQLSDLKLDLSGYELQSIGLSGKTIGLTMSALSLCVYEKPELNDKELLIKLAQTINEKFKIHQA